jgi:hypothetical protein
MENIIATLQYTLKDVDVQGQPVIIQMIQNVITALQKVMVVKRSRWAEEDEKDMRCKCGCEDTVRKQSS